MRFAKVARIQDFLPESVDWDKYIATGYEQRVRDDIADAENAAMLDIAKMHAKQIKKAGIAAEQQIVKQADNALIGDAIGAVANIGFAGAKAGWFKGGGGGYELSTDPAHYLSDERTKNTIENIDDGLTLLKSLRPVTFYYNKEYDTNPERMHYGFIAQEYQQVMPDQTYYDGSIDKLAIDTNELIAVLVRAIQQLEGRIESLELSLEA